MFDILEARSLVEDASVLDLFAGSGALGVEALSRGAAAVTFIESDARAAVAIEANLRSTDLLVPTAHVVRADALAWLAGRPTWEEPFDLALADPPYRFAEWPLLLERLRARTVLLEHSGPVAFGVGYEIIREYRYGGTLVTLAKATEAVRPDTTHKDPA
jgi:16S rRNA (guanine966-N2)-methyltransferase